MTSGTTGYRDYYQSFEFLNIIKYKDLSLLYLHIPKLIQVTPSLFPLFMSQLRIAGLMSQINVSMATSKWRKKQVWHTLTCHWNMDINMLQHPLKKVVGFSGQVGIEPQTS